MMLKQFSQKRNKGFNNLSDASCELLLNHPWPGNVRELKNLMEWATFMYDGPLLLPEHIQHRLTIPGGISVIADTTAAASPGKPKKEIDITDIQNAINLCKGNKTKAAQHLGISIRTLYNRLSG